MAGFCELPEAENENFANGLAGAVVVEDVGVLCGRKEKSEITVPAVAAGDAAVPPRLKTAPAAPAGC